MLIYFSHAQNSFVQGRPLSNKLISADGFTSHTASFRKALLTQQHRKLVAGQVLKRFAAFRVTPANASSWVHRKTSYMHIPSK